MADFLVIGGGIVGLTIALEALRRFDGAEVTLIEKEPACGLHASGRNSGVLHAGFYYSADSLKARLTRDGNHAMTVYQQPSRQLLHLAEAHHMTGHITWFCLFEGLEEAPRP